MIPNEISTTVAAELFRIEGTYDCDVLLCGASCLGALVARFFSTHYFTPLPLSETCYTVIVVPSNFVNENPLKVSLKQPLLSFRMLIAMSSPSLIASVASVRQ